MASLHACPRELTDSILKQVSTCDLAAMSLTSKKKPELATCIKSVRLRDGEPEIQRLFQDPYDHQRRTPKASPPQPTDGDGMPKFFSFIAGSGLSYADLWIEKLRAGNLNACVALLLSKLSNLATFRVGYAVVLADLEGLDNGRTPPKTEGENQFLSKMLQSAAFDTSNHGLSRF
ncbi:hypothetical protein BU23DRAFT_575992 [Bimuria novae-zelandiae CBS 107.79]|uniref:F-box domain-containing protein n=1 Tax=Bimuria novae-zelandiae CBS 107.79 TaxID=1447943 RepID=A0A6A5UMA4_9PLEO|nr:hypothetical protein BU23DRAFT_575992 [Bimuria novae-zelandiae CBS 107.79]